MSAAVALLAMGLLVALLVHGRWSAAALFPVWAGGFYMMGTIDAGTLLGSYSNPALVTLVLVVLVTLAFERTSLMEALTGWLLRGPEMLARVRLMGVAATLSAFMNNTAVVGALLGAITRQTRLPASRLLIPLSYASILGGITTLVGTSTNLVVNSFVTHNGLPPIGMFTPALVGIPVALACMVAMMFGSRTLPVHTPSGDLLAQPYFLEARIENSSALVGRSIEDNGLRHLDGWYLVELVREGQLISPVGPQEVLRAGDTLIFTGELNKLHRLQAFDGLELFGRRSDALLKSNLLEVVVSSGSELPGKTLRELDFRTMFDAGVVAIRRGNRQLSGQLGRIPLKVGDGLLLAVGKDFAQHRNIERNFHVLGEGGHRPRLSFSHSVAVLAGFLMVVALAAANLVPLLNGLIVLLGLFLARGWLSLADLRRRFPFELLMVIGSALALSKALDATGATRLMADAVHVAFGGMGVFGAMVGVYLLTVLLTELVTNNAAAALAFPMAFATANAFGVDAMPFIMVVLYGASACFLLPFGYQTHLMVMTPGRYRVVDYLKAGVPVSLVYSLVVLLLVPVFFPFNPA